MSYFLDILINLLSFLWNITKVLVPIMIVIEIFKDTKLIDKISDFFYPVTKLFTLSKISGISLLFGIFFGLTFGAGAILQSVKDYNVDKRSVFLLVMFLGPCHAVFEDTFVMNAAGASIVPLLAARFISAIIATFIFSRAIKKEPIDAIDKH
ncbi:MAG TPA: nucleoside recognition protein [Clostridiales bacterium]|mgnify:FL=1|nr:nucleoside recognition protein [Clostridiales bacterium]